MMGLQANFIGKNGFVWGIGVVEDRQDPLMLGRCRVRVFGIHTENTKDIPIEDLPWAYPLSPVFSASVSGIGQTPIGPVEGTWVIVFFKDGESMQEPIILGTLLGIPTNQENTPTNNIKDFLGFQDPKLTDGNQPPVSIEFKDDGEGVVITEGSDDGYPRKSHIGEADSNRLARNSNIDNTIVKSKKDSIEVGQTDVRTAETYLFGKKTDPGEPFTEPETPYAAKYPFNHVQETESGHIIEYDDTPGAERIHEYHRAGTFREIHQDGKRVDKIVSDMYNIVLKNNYIHIEGKSTETIDKGKKLLVNKDEDGYNLDIEVGSNGNLNITVKQGDVNLNVLDGNINKYVNGNVKEWITGNVERIIEGNVDENIDGNKTTRIKGNKTEIVGKFDIKTVGQNQVTKITGNKFDIIVGNIMQYIGGTDTRISTGLMTRIGLIISLNP